THSASQATDVNFNTPQPRLETSHHAGCGFALFIIASLAPGAPADKACSRPGDVTLAPANSSAAMRVESSGAARLLTQVLWLSPPSTTALAACAAHARKKRSRAAG